MSLFKSFKNKSPLLQYVMDHSDRQTKEQKELMEMTLKHPRHPMLGPPESLQLNANLMKLMRAKKVLDIGVYTGASALSAALALPEDGKVFALDITDEYYEMGKPFIEKAGVAHKITLLLGQAVDTLKRLIDEGNAGTFDFAFVDADKESLDAYYEHCMTLIRPGGVIAFDNTIWDGAVIDPSDQTKSTECVRRLNSKLKDDQRIDLSFLMIGDGLSLCFKK